MKLKMMIIILILSLVAALSFGANWGEALQKAIYFFECEQAGPLMPGNRVEWRGNATMHDGVLGGWYDAGDHVKFNLPMAYTASMMGWAEYEYKSAIQSSGQLGYLENNVKFALDYLASCWNGTTYVYQVGAGGNDHSWWGPVEVLENKTSTVSIRPLASASSGLSAVMAETAAALALGYINFGNATYLSKAKALFAKADADKSDANYTAANGFYNSWSGFYDELIFAGYWLYKATGDSSYLTKAIGYIGNLGKEGQSTDIAYMWGHCWDDVHNGALVLLMREGNADAKKATEMHLGWWVAGAKGKTPGGLSYLDSWGSLRYASAASFLAFLYSDWSGADSAKAAAYKTWAVSQMNYMTGTNERNASYIVGYGTNPPQHPHHRTAHGSWSDQQSVPPNHRHTIYGGLVGGPSSTGAFSDDIAQYAYTEVACDYNGSFIASASKMYSLYGGAALAGFPAAEAKDDEFFAEAALNSTAPNYTEIKVLCNNRSGWPARVIPNLSFRYFLDLSEVIAAGASASSITLSTNYVEFPGTLTGPTQWSGNIYYVQFSFTDGTKIFPGGQSEYAGEVQFRIAAPQGTSYWDPTNDPSFQGLPPAGTTPVKTALIPVYDGTTKIFGTEPGGSTITTAPTAAPTTPPVVTAAPTAVPTTPPVVTPAPTSVPTATPAGTPVPTSVPTATPAGTAAPTAVPTTPPAVTAAPTAAPTQPPSGTCTCKAGCASATAITAPFVKDGAGEFCFTASSLGSYVNSWNLDALEINGVNFLNKYGSAGQLPAKVNNLYYVYYKGSFAWSHFEAK
jgi:endoglucanase